MRVILDIKESKASAFLAFIKSLDFIEVRKEDSEDWYDELTEEQKASIQRGLDDIENGRVHTHEDVKKRIREKLEKAKRA